MKIVRSLVLVCALSVSQLSVSAEVTTKNKDDVILKSKRFSTLLTNTAKENDVRAGDLKSASTGLHAVNIGIKGIIAAEVIAIVYVSGAAAAAAPYTGEIGTKIISDFFIGLTRIMTGAASVPGGVLLAHSTHQYAEGSLIENGLNSQLANLGEMAKKADLRLRQTSTNADSMGHEELIDYAKSTEESLMKLSGLYLKSQIALGDHTRKVVAEADPSNEGYLKRIIYIGSDQLKYGELVQISAIAQSELAKSFRKVNDNLRAELIAARAIISARN